ncbi:ornithine carbamoyltransferase [Candidatus Micrarchaeota archaeon]|nr:ornithine carbamoyltransferase [Candidatus Micrarchaeota archaeon]
MHLRSLNDLTRKELTEIIDKAIEIKKNPKDFSTAMKDKTLMMLFEKPSLRTRISFETGMTRMGGHAIFYSIKDSPLGKKESIEDTAKTASRYVDIIMARLFKQEDLDALAKYSDVPVINALTNKYHPCQIIADLQTIKEKKGKHKEIKLAYLGDSNNNVTHSLLLGCSMVGMNISIGCPKGKEFEPQKDVLDKAMENAKETGSKVEILNDAEKAVENADVIYTDSWMSYHIPEDQQEARVKLFMPFQVNEALMSKAKDDAVFMNCLPAIRGMEQTAEVIDGKQSIVFDQAENRLHAQNAIMLNLMKKWEK